jgi:hypothetical protein
MAARNPLSRANRPSRTAPRSRLLMPSATPMIALYSGPTTIAATMRTCSAQQHRAGGSVRHSGGPTPHRQPCIFGREDVDQRFRPGFPGFEVVRA